MKEFYIYYNTDYARGNFRHHNLIKYIDGVKEVETFCDFEKHLMYIVANELLENGYTQLEKDKEN